MLSKNNSVSGIYNVYGGGNSSYTHNEYNLEGFNILISRVGNNQITLVNEKFYLTDNGFSIMIDNIKIKKYIGYYLIKNNSIINKISNGSAQKVISKTQLKNLQIPIPKNKELITNLEPMFKKVEELQNTIKESEIEYKQYIQELTNDAIIE